MCRLRDLAGVHGFNERRDDCSIGVLYLGGDDGGEHLVMTWYKERGRVDDAFVVCCGDIRQFTREDAERCIAYYDRLAPLEKQVKYSLCNHLGEKDSLTNDQRLTIHRLLAANLMRWPLDDGFYRLGNDKWMFEADFNPTQDYNAYRMCELKIEELRLTSKLEAVIASRSTEGKGLMATAIDRCLAMLVVLGIESLAR